MIDERIEQVEASAFDAQIDRMLSSFETESGIPGIPDDSYILGVRNEEGDVYRRFEVRGARAVIRINDALRRLGFNPEPSLQGAHPSGCNIVFSQTTARQEPATQRRMTRVTPSARQISRPMRASSTSDLASVMPRWTASSVSSTVSPPPD